MKKYKLLLDTLRKHLEELISRCIETGLLKVKDASTTADIIFVIADGAYYYLSLADNKNEYQNKLEKYKSRAIALLELPESVVNGYYGKWQKQQ